MKKTKRTVLDHYLTEHLNGISSKEEFMDIVNSKIELWNKDHTENTVVSWKLQTSPNYESYDIELWAEVALSEKQIERAKNKRRKRAEKELQEYARLKAKYGK